MTKRGNKQHQYQHQQQQDKNVQAHTASRPVAGSASSSSRIDYPQAHLMKEAEHQAKEQQQSAKDKEHEQQPMAKAHEKQSIVKEHERQPVAKEQRKQLEVQVEQGKQTFSAPANKYSMLRTDNVFFLLEEKGRHNMTCAGCWVFEDRCDEGSVKQLFMRWVATNPIFAQKLAGSTWKAMPDFDVNKHLAFVKLAAPYGQNELEAAAAEAIAVPFDARAPLWKAVVATNYNSKQWAMMLFIHHAYGDGSSTLRSLFNLADEKETSASKHRKMSSSGTAVEQQQPQPQQQPQSQLVTSNWFGTVLDLAHLLVMWVLDVLFIFWKWFCIVKQPKLSFDYGTRSDFASLKDSFFATIGYHKDDVLSKEMAFSHSVPLSEIKTICRSQHVAPGAVIMAVVTRALRAHFDEKGCLNSMEDFFCLVPTAIHEPTPSSSPSTDLFVPGNAVTSVVMNMPIHIAEPLDTLHTVQVQMDYIKMSWERLTHYLGLMALGMLPQFVTRYLLSYLKRRVHGVIVTMQGPHKAVAFGGHKVSEFYSIAPQSCPGGVGISVVSYDAKVTVTFLADRHEKKANAHSLMNHFHQELDKMQTIATSKAVCPGQTSCHVCKKGSSDELLHNH